MAYDLVPVPGTGDNGYRPNFSRPGIDSPPRGPSPYDEEVLQRARAAAQQRTATAAPAAPAAPAAAPTLRQPPGVIQNAYDYAVGKPPVGPQPKGSFVGGLKNAAMGGGSMAPIMGAAAAGAEEVPKTLRVAGDPSASNIDVATQAAEGVAKIGARGAGVGIGAKLGGAAGAALGTAVLPGVGTWLGGLAGAGLGGWAGDRLANAGVDAAIKTGREALGVNPQSPVVQTQARTEAAKPAAPSLAQPTPAAAPTAAQPVATAAPTIRRVGNEYSGTNIGPGATIDNPRNGGGSLTVVPGMSQAEINRTLTNPDGSRWTAQDNATMRANLEAGRNPYEGTSRYAGMQAAAQAANAQALNAIAANSGSGLPDLMSPEYEMERRARMSGGGMEMKPGESRAAYAARIGAMTTMRGQDLSERASLRTDGTTRRGQDLTYGATTRGQDLVNSATLRGQDMDLEGRIAPKRLELEMAQRMRGVASDIYKQSGGNMNRAAQIAAANGFGDIAKHFLETGKGMTDAAAASGKHVDRFLEPFATSTDKDGKGYVDPAKLAAARQVLGQMAPDYETTDDPSKVLSNPDVTSALKILQSMNSDQMRDDTFWKKIGLAKRDPIRSTLPDLRNSNVTTEGFFEGKLPWGTNTGDYNLQLGPGGKTTGLRREDMSEAELDFLKRNGVRFGN